MSASTGNRLQVRRPTHRIATGPRFDGLTVLRFLWLALALVAALQFGTARADSAVASLQVSARVLPHARLDGDASGVSLTSTDVQRGYVDVARHYRLQTNSPERVVLQLNPRVGLTDAIDVAGLRAPLRMNGESVEVTQPLAREFTLRYRLWLNSAAVPGHYPLPVQVAALVR